jgi:phosphoribosylglycinamide formyltransferase 2
MNRKAIRDLAAAELGLKTAPYRYATSYEELAAGAAAVGMPCVVKPLMSSSGKGQSVIRTADDIQRAWDYALSGSRGDLAEVIVESFIDFDYEITLLTLTQKDGPTLFCPPIGHRQERGDYQESWQPMPMAPHLLEEAQRMAESVTASLRGAGIWGVEFFIQNPTAESNGTVYFSELSPRPHDTGMVTLAGTQNFTEFELHARAVLGIPVLSIDHVRNGASAVVLAPEGVQADASRVVRVAADAVMPDTDFRIFGKPSVRPYRRMAVGLAHGPLDSDAHGLVAKAQEVAGKLSVG